MRESREPAGRRPQGSADRVYMVVMLSSLKVVYSMGRLRAAHV